MVPGKVYVKKLSSRKNLQLAWLCPKTGRERRKSAGTTRMREATLAANALERKLRRTVELDTLDWGDFCHRYETEHIANLREKSQTDWPTCRDAVNRILEPETVQALTASRISEFAATLRRQGKSAGVVARYLTTLRTSLKWAANLRIIDECPFIRINHKARGQRMHGRPITTEEFERMLLAVPRATRKMWEKKPHKERRLIVASWRHTLRVLWLSGIRLQEIGDIYWDRPDRISIESLECPRPSIRINADFEKGGRDRLLPITPDFVGYLRRIPAQCRRGRLCKPITSTGPTHSDITIGRVISRCGRLANVVVREYDDGQKKFASAHDLRRSFGTRWAALVQPAILQQLMRHTSIDTTMKFYVSLRAEQMGDVLWAQADAVAGSSDILGDTKRQTACEFDREY